MGNGNLVFEESPVKLKIVILLRTNWLLFSLFAVSLIVWTAMLVVVLAYLVRGRSSGAVLTIILLVWTVIWLWFGRFLWRRWQYYAATREILIIDQEQLIVRRPVSILGLTTSYDWRHVSPFYFSEKHQRPAFDYAYHHVYFAEGLESSQAKELVRTLNARFFADEEDA